MKRHAFLLVFLMLTSMFLMSISVTDNPILERVGMEPLNNETISDGPLEPLQVNVVQNPSFEDFPSDGYPTEFTGSMSASNYVNETYNDPVNVIYGTYAAHMVAEGNRWLSSTAYLSPTYEFVDAFLTYGIEYEFYWNMLSQPDATGYSRIMLMTRDDANHVQRLNYYFNSPSVPGNSTDDVFFPVVDSLDQWNYFKVNVTEEYMSYFGAPDASRKMVACYFYAYSPQYPTGPIQQLIDDVSLSNLTYSGWLFNGGFEMGTGAYWGGSLSSPGYISESSDSTDGVKSLNVTSLDTGVGSSYAYVEQSYLYPHEGFFASGPGDAILDINYKYSDTIGTVGSNAYAYLRFSLRNMTSYCNLYLYMGTYDDIIHASNYSSDMYYQLDGFYTHDVWNHEQIDIYPYIVDAKFTNMEIDKITLYTYSNVAGGKVQLLVDNLQLITYPTADPGFEQDWYQDGQTPFAAWDSSSGNPTRTFDSHQGVYACNLTATHPSATAIVNLWRQLHVELTTDDCINFWWRLDEMSSVISSYTYLYLRFNSSYFIYYIIGTDGTWAPTNESSSGFLYVENYNQTGIWTNLVRNLTGDLGALFGDGYTWELDQIGFVGLAGATGRISVLLDDMHLSDGGAPIVDSVDFLPVDPMFYETVDVSVYTHDIRSDIQQVYVDYNNGTGWYGIPASLNVDHYEATIPSHVYGTEIQFQVSVTDTASQNTVDNNGGLLYTYTVGDDIGPTLAIDTPLDTDEIEGTIHVNATANDLGSGIDYVDFRIDDISMDNISLSPYSYVWDTDLVSLGIHEIKAIAYDIAGNSIMDIISVTVIDSTIPVMNSPDDIEFSEGEVGFNILWSPQDARPSSYSLYINDILTYSGDWNSSSESFNISLDGLSPMIYNYTLIVIDEAGNALADTVIVTVNETVFTSSTTSTTTTTTETSTGIETSTSSTITVSSTTVVTTTTTNETPTSSTTPSFTSIDTTILLMVGGVILIILVLVVVFAKKKK